MNQASVGFHCPSCLASGKQEVRTGAAAFDWAGKGYVTIAIIAVNAVAFVASLGGGSGLSPRSSVVGDFAIAGPFIAENDEWYRLITGAFLHANLIHIGFNMYLVWILGRQIESVIGPWRYLMLYFATLLAGSFGAVLVTPNAFTLGASGAGFGLFGAMAIAQRASGISIWSSGLGPILGLNLFLTFAVSGISIGGHIGGLVGGGVVGWLIWELPRVTRNRWLGDVLVAVFGLLMLVGGLWAATTWTSPIF